MQVSVLADGRCRRCRRCLRCSSCRRWHSQCCGNPWVSRRLQAAAAQAHAAATPNTAACTPLLVMEPLLTLATETVLLQAVRQPQLSALHLETRVEPSRK
jgi:hypothetical protein